MTKQLPPAVVLCCLVATTSCSDPERTLRMMEPRLGIDQIIAGEFAELLDSESMVSVTLVPSTDNSLSGVDALLADQADIALVSNNVPYVEGVSTVMPLYANVLHILLKRPLDAENVDELFTAGRIFAGPPGSPSRVMLTNYAESQDIDVDSLRFIEVVDGDCPEVIAIFAPILRDMESRVRQCENGDSFQLWSFGSPDELGTGSAIDATTLLDPNLRTFIVPEGTYGDITPEPVVTLAVDKMLVARDDVPQAVVYDLVSEVLRLRPALAAVQPTLFHEIRPDFDWTGSTFVLHPGAQDYLEKDEPNIYERYSGIAEVIVTLFVAVLSGSIAAVRIYNIRRKNRIDTFYAAAIRLRESASDTTPADERRKIISEVRQLQTRAFELLVDEKVAADESFRIFITLSNDIIGELKQPSAPDWSTPPDPA